MYAFDTASTNLKWIYCTETESASANPCPETELPLGQAPTYENGVLYFAGLDKKVHAINANTGAKIWTFDNATASYETNPVVVNNTVYLGNRDGGFYAIDAGNGSEYSFDSNRNSQKEYALFLWSGTHSGTRYPGVVGNDKAYYLVAPHLTGGFVSSAGILGWKFGTPDVNVPSDFRYAGDEPVALSGGGSFIGIGK